MEAIPLGKIAYDAYCYSRNWVSFRGEALPPWNQQTNAMKEAWESAAEAVIAEYQRRRDGE